IGAHLAGDARDWDLETLGKELVAIAPLSIDVTKEVEEQLEKETDIEQVRRVFEDMVVEKVGEALAKRKEELGQSEFATAVRRLLLRSIDTIRMDHLDEMERLRDTVRLRAYAQRDPLVEYKNE